LIKHRWNKVLNSLGKLLEEKILRKQSPFVRKKTLLIVRLDSIGDYILFRNFIPQLKISEIYKDYKITLCGNSWWKDLAVNLDKNEVSTFIWVDYFKMLTPLYRVRIYLKIYLKGFEIVLHPTYSRDAISDGIVIHSGAKLKIGNSGDSRNYSFEEKLNMDRFYTELIPQSENDFEFNRNYDFFSNFLKAKLEVVKPSIEILSSEGKDIVFCIGAKTSDRCWSAQNFANLAQLINNKFPIYNLILCGTKNDRERAALIIEKTKLNITDYTGEQNLMELCRTLSKGKIIVTNDSGPFHIAVALNKNVICISNGNNYGRFSPYPDNMGTKSVTFYPEIVRQSLEIDSKYKSRLQAENSSADINTIQPADIFNYVLRKKWLE
jgi:ADP-heptose:LPS heptosyltransferase